MMGQDHVLRLLEALSTAYDQTIVDGGSTFNERSLALLEQANRVVLLVVPEIPAVRAMHTLLEMLSELGAAPERQFLLLNHVYQHDMLRLDDLERSVQATIQAELPYDGVAYLRAVNEGVPVLVSTNRGAAAAALEKVVAAVLDEPSPQRPNPAARASSCPSSRCGRLPRAAADRTDGRAVHRRFACTIRRRVLP